MLRSHHYKFILKLLGAVILLVFFLNIKAQPPVNDPARLGNGMPNVTPGTQMPPAQLYEALKDKNPGKDKSTLGVDLNKALKIEKDSIVEDDITQSAVNPENDTYGMHLFKGKAIAEVTELSTPPLDYPIGVSDQLIVSLWGGAEASFEYNVARDGSIFPTGLGKIYVQGLTFENARALIRSRFMTVVPPGTNLTVSLGQPRSIHVNVAGEVNIQGPVTVSAFSNAFNVIAMAGGPTSMANLREIQIKRNGKIIETLDVYKYLTAGDFGRHIYLDNNDFVIVTTVEKKVQAEGKFRRPMYYQLKKDEGIKALLKYSGGLETEAFSSGMKVFRTESEKQVIKDVNATAIMNPLHDPRLENEDYPLMDGDVVKVIAINPGLSNKIEIQGEVSYPGVYEYRKGDRVFDVINRAGGITKNTYLYRAYIFRGAGDSTTVKSNKIEINLSDIEKNNNASVNNVALNANDLIVLFGKNQFADRQYVEIFGEVRKPQKINRYGGMTLQDLIYLSGGLKQSAEFGRIEIASVLNIDTTNDLQQPIRTIIKTIRVNPSLELDSVSAKIELKPYDQVYVRKNPEFELQQIIKIDGLVNYPGAYPKIDKFERLSSYIERAGGIRENADLSGAILFRKSSQFYQGRVNNSLADIEASLKADIVSSVKSIDEEPVSIELYKALKYPNSKYDIVLQEGDRLYVPEINPFVSVAGVVQSPLKLAFDKEHTNLGFYIDKAGGFGIKPWRRRIYVTYANGKSRRTFNLLFFHFYPKVKEGSVIVVPGRPEGAEVTDIVKQIFVSAVPIITASIIAKYIIK